MATLYFTRIVQSRIMRFFLRSILFILFCCRAVKLKVFYAAVLESHHATKPGRIIWIKKIREFKSEQIDNCDFFLVTVKYFLLTPFAKHILVFKTKIS